MGAKFLDEFFSEENWLSEKDGLKEAMFNMFEDHWDDAVGSRFADVDIFEVLALFYERMHLPPTKEKKRPKQSTD